MNTHSMRTEAVLARGLTKSYGPVHAVCGLDLTVHAGEAFGFLGPNGAGKSTSIAMLSTLLRPTAGRAEVAGHDIRDEQDAVRRAIGIVFQETTVDVDLTAEENLRFHADLYGMPRREARGRIASMLDLVGLTERSTRAVRTFSGGMRRRLEIARGMLHTPRVLFLDEPTTGLDPQTRAAIWGYLHRLREESGTTLFMTTHQLEEAEHCDRIAVVDEGRVVVEGSPAQLKAVIGDDLVVLRTRDNDSALRSVREQFGLRAVVEESELRVRVADGAAFVPRLCRQLTVPVYSVSVTSPTLDDVFLHYTGRTIREADIRGPEAKG
ncbi:ATP-binding cassette domain-containing protein [Embleya sp. NPDC050493]|uniref:ATP-binding cassette domain-containing protein n=1 Tax=Embleya sp. NPDC050493 TaxID=3363989 RepID=UPI0037A3901E